LFLHKFAFLKFFGRFWHFLAFLSFFWHVWGHFLAFLALNTTFGIEDILFLPVSRPSVEAVKY
jgi:hypothetical protein